MSRTTVAAFSLLLLAASRLGVALAAPADVPAKPVAAAAGPAAEVTALLADLDSDRYQVRQRAAERLAQLAADPARAELLARELHRVLVLPTTSLEVRKQLERLGHRLPKVSIPPDERVKDEELDRLIGQLQDDSYGARLAAAKRLEWLLGNPALTNPIMSRLKQRLSAAPPTPDVRQSLEPVYQRAREAWLTSDPAAWDLPPIADVQLRRWVDDVAAAGPPGSAAERARQAAVRELRDALARDAIVPKIKDLLTARLADPKLAPAATGSLKGLLDLTRPGMVAEFWDGHRHVGTQNLLVGVPSWGVGAERPSHFDFIDDRRAHCVSGQNLSPGDYPVGVAFPHPKNPGALFHLVNLTTPRRLMAYEFQNRRPEAVRLAEISRRTLDRLLALKRGLTAKELRLLEQLDPAEVSRFAGALFQAVDDQPLPLQEADPTVGHPSRHNMLCAILAVSGTREAIPGLLKALANQRFLRPTEDAPYRFGWLAALAIAARDPWPEVDAWLLGLLDRNDPLVDGVPNPPEVGATAAGVLAKRGQQAPSKLGLEPVADDTLREFGLSGFRFTLPASRDAVRQWWADRKKDGSQGKRKTGEE